jgi:hypothetical protein
MLSVDTQQNDEIGIGMSFGLAAHLLSYIRSYTANMFLDASIVEGDARSPTKIYDFADIVTPLG